MPIKVLPESPAKQGYSLKTIALLGLLLIALTEYAQGQSQKAVGVGAGLGNTPVDRAFEVYEIVNPIPIKDLPGYYTTEIPAVLLPLEDSRYRLRFGANSVSIIYKNKVERIISATQTERTVFEIINLNLYAGLQSPGKSLWLCDGYWVGGLLLSENLLIKAIETHSVLASGEAEVTRAKQADYQVDYSFGLMLGTGISRSLGRFGEIALQTTLFAVNTALTLPDGHKPNPSTMQLQLFYWINFD